ncbi:helix-turn-helix transcriptional regulator [Chachezhania antarctica]|uniref:helix-turn-helix transcriptional regulator n=1 Tax=Chachezhania antarctica TaxID=2340860 RepID=UPI000EB4C49C|nr:helix-turn-helix transcriptional regulator [Chachezhania antarctica]|tara:strand:- start:3961 stop:4692 length:732 start_codon:yes stop_codon:yes gene_type:complete
MDHAIRDVSLSDMRLFGDIVTRLNRAEPWEDIRGQILGDLARLLRADYGASYVWSQKAGRYGNATVLNMDPDNIARYEAWFQYRDPITDRLRALARPALIEEVMPYEDLHRTEFYTDFLARDGLSHGINLFLVDDGCDLGDFRLWRGHRAPEFGARELGLLSALEPFLKTALRRRTGEGSTLTPREADVVRLVARGCTDRDIARLLEISHGTVRTHLGRAMAKEGCANRSELAALYAAQLRDN